MAEGQEAGTYRSCHFTTRDHMCYRGHCPSRFAIKMPNSVLQPHLPFRRLGNPCPLRKLFITPQLLHTVVCFFSRFFSPRLGSHSTACKIFLVFHLVVIMSSAATETGSQDSKHPYTAAEIETKDSVTAQSAGFGSRQSDIVRGGGGFTSSLSVSCS